MKKFFLFSVYGRGHQEDAYIDAESEADCIMDDEWFELDEWLSENIKNSYEISHDYMHIDFHEVRLDVSIIFEEIADAMAFKLVWL